MCQVKQVRLRLHRQDYCHLQEQLNQFKIKSRYFVLILIILFLYFVYFKQQLGQPSSRESRLQQKEHAFLPPPHLIIASELRALTAQGSLIIWIQSSNSNALLLASSIMSLQSRKSQGTEGEITLQGRGREHVSK